MISIRLVFTDILFGQGPPSKPVNVKALITPTNALPSDQMIELSWNEPVAKPSFPGEQIEYLVEMMEEKGNRWVAVSSGAPLTDARMIIPLELMKESVNYQFRVVAKNKAGSSPTSEPSSRIQKRTFLCNVYFY